jgi:phosphatidylinositol-3-phosphatase
LTAGRFPTPAAALALCLCLCLCGCGNGGPRTQLPAQTHPSPKLHPPGGPPAHVAVIVMENEEFSDIIGSSETPYINQLARGNALARQMYAIRHPSLPNYLALTSGSTHGIDSDCTDCSVPGTGLPGQLAARGISWRAYMEDLPIPCFTGSEHERYAKKHDPFVYFRGVLANRSLCSQVVPFGRLLADERARRLPAFVWITPNMCHDMHDCDPVVGDRFLAATVPPLLSAMGPRSLLILTWDEGSSDNGCCRLASGGHIVTVLAGPLARPGARMRTPSDHYSVLQTIEDLFGLPRMAGAGCTCTPSLAPLLSFGH